MAETGIGAAVRRREDVRFLRGAGNYTDDMNLAGQAHAYILRSPHAHAKIGSMDTAAASAAAGVVAILTAADFEGVGGLPCGWQVNNKDGTPMSEPKHPVLAEGKVRHVGDPVAVVIAETRNQARDAAEKINVNYEILDAALNMNEALVLTRQLFTTM